MDKIAEEFIILTIVLLVLCLLILLTCYYFFITRKLSKYNRRVTYSIQKRVPVHDQWTETGSDLKSVTFNLGGHLIPRNSTVDYHQFPSAPNYPPPPVPANPHYISSPYETPIVPDTEEPIVVDKYLQSEEPDTEVDIHQAQIHNLEAASEVLIDRIGRIEKRLKRNNI